MNINGQPHATAFLTPGKEPHSTHLTGGWVGSSPGLDDLKKSLTPAGNRNTTVQPVACRCTDWGYGKGYNSLYNTLFRGTTH
jgi:hypothetical protein